MESRSTFQQRGGKTTLPTLKLDLSFRRSYSKNREFWFSDFRDFFVVIFQKFSD